MIFIGYQGNRKNRGRGMGMVGGGKRKGCRKCWSGGELRFDFKRLYKDGYQGFDLQNSEKPNQSSSHSSSSYFST